jgi:hypothetical protein
VTLSGLEAVLVHYPVHEAMHDVHRIMRSADRLTTGISQSNYALCPTGRQAVT